MYLLFAGFNHVKRGGAKDFINVFDTIELAKAEISKYITKNKDYVDWCHIAKQDTLQIVIYGEIEYKYNDVTSSLAYVNNVHKITWSEV